MQLGILVDKRYRIEAHAGRGGMGAVYRAHDLRRDRPVALKVMRISSDQELARYQREVTLLATVHHPGVVSFVSHGVAENGDRYLAMEWVEGDTLAEVVLERGLVVPEVVAVGLSVAEALDSLHAKNIVHRDVKPQNIIVWFADHPRAAKLIDFGVARDQELPRVTLQGDLVGSPGYMSPEQAKASSPIDARSDLFSLGCVLYECLSGRRPFTGLDPLAVRWKLLQYAPPCIGRLNPAVSPALAALVHELMSKRPDDRPSSAAEVARRLAALKEARGVRRKLERGSTFAESPTLITSGAPEAMVVVLVGDPPRSEPSATLTALGAAFPELSPEPLGEGWYAATLPGRQEDPRTFEEAEKRVLALRARLPDAPIIFAAGAGGDLQELIDEAVRVSAEEQKDRLFPESSRHPGDAAIRLLGALSASTFRAEVRTTSSGTYLIPTAG